MRRNRPVMILSLAAALFGSGPALGGEAGPFLEVVHRALAGNPRIQAAAANLASARENEHQARAALLPDVEADITLSHSEADWAGGELRLDTREGELSLTQAVYNQAALEAIDRVEPYIAAFEQTLASERQGVLMSVVQASLALLEAREVARLAQSNREVTERNLEATRARHRVGEITRTDVSQASARLASAQAELLRAENAVSVSAAQFREVVGEDPPEGLTVPALESPLLAESAAALTQQAVDRPDVRAAQRQLAVAERAIAIQEAGHLPTVALSATASRGWEQGFVTRTDPVDQYAIALGVTIPIYSGGETTSLADQARADRDAQAASLDQLLRQAAREISQAVSNHRNAQAVTRSLEAAEEAAREAATGVEQEYRVGSRTALDLLEAQNELFTSQTDLARGRFSLIETQYAILQATGRLLLEELVFAADGLQ